MITISSIQNFHPLRDEMDVEKLRALIDEKVKELLEVHAVVGNGGSDKVSITLTLRIKDENEELNVTHQFEAALGALQSPFRE